jgi:hypothetical protein
MVTFLFAYFIDYHIIIKAPHSNTQPIPAPMMLELAIKNAIHL